MDFLDRNRKKLMYALLALAAALAVIGYLTLPEELTMQLSFGGTPVNRMSKPVGLLLPFGLTSVFALLFGRAEARADQWKYFIISLVGLLVYGFTFAVNLLSA